ncbi:hypothetical protein LOD99_14288 [Oopsacas minuta]|uniref:BZIP domain-containing protein n=1 Tax=Oopsacas minuta TaxID=111878 RepID=A0AAV7KGD5_9METZ|nr:hypothetical protein LOD99_14288 [Oopsacas minuta]
MASSKKSSVNGLNIPQLSELIKLSPKLLNYKMTALKLTEEQKCAVKRKRRLEKARLYEKKKRCNIDFEINMLEAERNALLAVLDDLHEDVAQLKKEKKSITNTEVEINQEEVQCNQQQAFNNSFISNVIENQQQYSLLESQHEWYPYSAYPKNHYYN